MYDNGTKFSVLAFCCFLSLSLPAKDIKTGNEHGLKKPLCFVENKGQITAGDNNTGNDVQYTLTAQGVSMYVSNGKLHYQFKKVEGAPSASQHIAGYGVDVILTGANPHAKVMATEQQAYYENYFLTGNDNGKNALTVHAFDKVTYKDIYPGIDWVLYVKNDKVEYDFIVRPGGNVGDIKIKYDGATALNIAKDGGIIAETPMGDINEQRPYSYETATGKAVASDFVLHNNVISFETGAYSGALTIDPYLIWSTYFGGTAEDVVTAVKESAAGETYIGGYTASSGLNTVGPAYGAATYEAFVTKYSVAGTRLFTTYLGSTTALKTTVCTGLAIDNTGANVYIAGYTNSAGLPATITAYSAMKDGFISMISATTGATVFWSTYFGGAKDDIINAISCDAANNVYITGQTASVAGIASGGAYQGSLQGINDAFAARFSGATGAKIWGTYYGGSAQEEGLGIATDATGNVFITGQTNSIIDIATTGAHQISLDGVNDAFVAKLNTAGTGLLWGTYLGGAGEEQGNGVVCNQTTGDIVIVGNTTSPDNIAGYKAFQPTYGGGLQDAFVSYLDGAGNMTWSTYLGGSQPDYGQGICYDNTGNIVITGGTFSSTNIAFPNAFQPAIGGDYDAYVAKFNPAGQRLWSTYFGGLYYDYANAIDCDNSGQLTIAGYTTSIGMYGSAAGIATAGADQTANMGGTYDGFVTKFKIDTFLQISQPFLDTVACAGGPLTVNYTSNYSFNAGNMLQVEISDNTGSFAAPTVIGTAASVPLTTSGTIACVIPAGITLGTHYRIRIVASAPAYTSPDDFYDIVIGSGLPSATPTGSTPACVGNSIVLDVSASYLLTGFKWAGPAGSGLAGAGFTSTSKNPSNDGFSGSGVTKADSGIYTITTSHNGCADMSATINIVVNDFIPPTPIITAAPSGCVASSISLYANPDTTAPGITYSWGGAEGFSSTLQNPVTPTVMFPGVHNYVVTDMIGGCSASSTIFVTVNDTTSVSVSITALPGDTICRGTTVSFKAIPVKGGVSAHYQWMSGIATPITGAISDVFSSPSLIDGETIFCTMNSSIECPWPITATSNLIAMNVISNPPVVKIFSSGSFVKSGDSVTFTSITYNAGSSPLYQWMLNGKDIDGATFNSYTLQNVTNADTISLKLTSTMECATPDFGISNPIIVQTNVGVTNLAASIDNIELFPNPNNGSFTVKGSYLGGTNTAASIEILNPIGQVVYETNATIQKNAINKTIDLRNVPDGVYLLRISAEGQSKTVRFSVTR